MRRNPSAPRSTREFVALADVGSLIPVVPSRSRNPPAVQSSAHAGSGSDTIVPTTRRTRYEPPSGWRSPDRADPSARTASKERVPDGERLSPMHRYAGSSDVELPPGVLVSRGRSRSFRSRVVSIDGSPRRDESTGSCPGDRASFESRNLDLLARPHHRVVVHGSEVAGARGTSGVGDRSHAGARRRARRSPPYGSLAVSIGRDSAARSRSEAPGRPAPSRALRSPRRRRAPAHGGAMVSRRFARAASTNATVSFASRRLFRICRGTRTIRSIRRFARSRTFCASSCRSSKRRIRSQAPGTLGCSSASASRAGARSVCCFATPTSSVAPPRGTLR